MPTGEQLRPQLSFCTLRDGTLRGFPPECGPYYRHGDGVANLGPLAALGAAPDFQRVGVRIPESFHQRIQSECLRRDLSLQEMVVDALKLYFRTPLEWDYATTTCVRHGEEEGQPLPEEEVARRNSWIGLWAKYVNAMPEEKIEVLTRAMEWDLRA